MSRDNRINCSHRVRVDRSVCHEDTSLSKTKSDATTYELKWNESNKRFEYTFTDSNGVLGNFDFSIDGFSVSKSGNSMTVYTKSVNTTATLGSFKSTIGAVDTTSSCVFWLTGNSGDQEFVSEQPSADPISAYIKVKTENIGYGEITKTDESSGVKLAGAVYGIYSDSGCTNLVGKMTTDSNGYAKSKALVAGTYYVKEITAPTTMLANSEFVALLKQANTDSSKMAEVIGVSDAQLRFVTNSQSGMGLLKCGNVVIPFDNQIGKDTSLYKLYNTNIHEKIAEQRAKENHVSVV